jgi:hypothetical protein
VIPNINLINRPAVAAKSLRHCGIAALLLLAAAGAYAQTRPTTEYIRMGGRVIALEHPITVSIALTGEPDVYPGQTRQFSATVGGTTTQTVTWAVVSPGIGTISSAGLYTAPATISSAQTVTIRATSTADTGATATAELHLKPALGVVLTPIGTSVVYGGQTVQFSATVGSGTIDWTLTPALGTISSSGLYTAPSLVDPPNAVNVTVRATSHLDSAHYAQSTVQLKPVSITMPDPPSSSIASGATLQFSATVDNPPNSSITWTATGGGTVSTTGLYTSQAGLTANQSVTVRAASSADSRVYAQKTITVVPDPGAVCSLSFYTWNFRNGGEFRDVTVTCPAGVVWGVSIPAGATWITTQQGSSANVVRITAAGYGVGTGTRSATIAIAGKAFAVNQLAAKTLTLTPANPYLVGHGGTLQFAADVPGVGNVASDAGTVWTLEGVGTQSNIGTLVSGLYTAPATIPVTLTAVRVKATYAIESAESSWVTVPLESYQPPSLDSVAPLNSTAATQSFTIVVSHSASVDNINRVTMNISPSSSDYSSGCAVAVTLNRSISWKKVSLVASGTSTFGEEVDLGTGAAIENARCRVLTTQSDVTYNGDTATISLTIQRKPGFLGTPAIWLQAFSRTNAATAVTQLSGATWNLTSNVAALPPSVTLESPAANATVQNTVAISGWALDNTTQRENKVTGVVVKVDGQALGPVTRVVRNDVCTGAVADRMDCPSAGFTINWNTVGLSNGTHTISIEATDGDLPASTNNSVTRTVTVNNPPAVLLVLSPSTAYVRARYGSGTPSSIEQQQFTATLTGGNPPPTDVQWTRSSTQASDPGTVTSAGLYTSGNYVQALPGAQVTITGTRTSNPAQTASATAVMVGVMTCGGTATPIVTGPTPYWYCMASVPLTNFTLTPSTNSGSVSSSMYIPPASNSTPRTVVLEGRSVYDNNIRYRLLITLNTY